ncbi:RNA-binding protein 48 isoform X2 [Chelonus insularis]|uniref:RNA-binding protein 48 isoform X2 n=1 Tax=Chelonus insularis TaxID=460826 RepID=UPI00158C51FB|nr:RNA-binding protein 48 isoform X2 [Chelonus insularis]
MANSLSSVEKLEHHIQQELCRTRPSYRQGKKLTAVKVYTINNESQHLIVTGVPKLNLIEDLRRISIPYGIIKELTIIPDYPSEEFTETFHIRYERIQSARIAKRFLDTKNFYGGILHVFYAPELESVAETRKKLIQRRREIAIRIQRQREEAINLTSDKFEPKEQYHRQKRHPALPLTEERLSKNYPGRTITDIYDGIPREIDPRPVSEPSLPTAKESLGQFSNSGSSITHNSQNDGSNDSGINEKKIRMKNYKGKTVNNDVKVKVLRPQLVDTKKLIQFTAPNMKIFSAVKKVDKGITIKLLPKLNETKRRIIVNDASW